MLNRMLGVGLEANAWASQSSEKAIESLVAARYSEPAAKRLVFS